MIYYVNGPVRAGTNIVSSLGNGTSINVTWYQALTNIKNYKIAYNIYYSVIKDEVFNEDIKFVSIDNSLQANIIDLVPGQDYFFAVRPVEYDPHVFDLTLLPIAYDNLRIYPTSLLRQNITSTDLIIPLLDVTDFPPIDVIRVGIELMQYQAVDRVNNNLILTGGIAPEASHFMVQPGGNFYLPFAGNVGIGNPANLLLTSSNAIAETWSIKCIFVQRDNLNIPIPNTAKFEAIGSVSGVERDIYSNPLIWVANGFVVSGNILSFSIIEGAIPFREGDGFTVQVIGETPGTNGGRGYNNTPISEHTTSGFDGRNTWNPIVPLFTLGESSEWDRIFACQSRFEYPNYQATLVDGYHQVTKDLLSTDLSAADADNVTFPMYDYAGYHRIDPVQLLNGTCVGSYIMGEAGCIDGYGNYNIYRGISLQDRNTQRQDVLLSVTGKPAVLI